FLNGFSARDLAEPLLSFDGTTPLVTIREAMRAQHLEVVGVRRSGEMTGWLTYDEVADDVAGNRESWDCRSFDPASVIADSASLNVVVQGLNVTPCLFVRSFGQVSGLIRRAD